MLFFLIIGLLIGAASVIFILQNVAAVTVTFFGWQLAGSLAIILLLALLAGILITIFFMFPSLVKTKFLISSLKKQNKKLADDLADIKKNFTSTVDPSQRVVEKQSTIARTETHTVEETIV